MKLATLRDGTRDGRLLVVRRDGAVATPSDDRWPTLQRALDDWDAAAPVLAGLAADLEAGAIDGIPVDPERLAAPLPRAYEWVDGSAYMNHVVLVRKARGAEPPPTLTTDPLVYQGGSSVLLGPTDPIRVRDLAWGADFESEVCGDPRRHASRAPPPPSASRHVRLLVLAQRRYASQPDAQRAGQGLRLLSAPSPPRRSRPSRLRPTSSAGRGRAVGVHLRLALDLQRRRSSAIATPARRCTSRSWT